ncbi:MAG: hypothetical protein H6512_08540 [Acidimicrobiia bacterium]|nr:hypothetical protein [Acidimicrobiia bacterium]
MYGKDADYAMTGNTNTICSAEDIDDVTAAINGLLDKLTVGGLGTGRTVGMATERWRAFRAIRSSADAIPGLVFNADGIGVDLQNCWIKRTSFRR